MALLAVCFVSSQQEEKDLLTNEQLRKAVQSYDSGGMETSLSQLQTLHEEHPGTEVSVLALYQMGMINYQLGNFEEARKHLELFLDDDPEDDIFRDGANLIIGLFAFKLKKWDKSIEHFSEVDGSESPYYVQGKKAPESCVRKDRRTRESRKNP